MIAAPMMIGLFAFAGLAVDVGYIQTMKLRAQSAADAAAEAALFELKDGKTDLTTAGQHDAALNGFTNGTNSTTVTINNPPLQGSYSGNSQAVEAVVVRTVPTFFMGILNFGTVNVTGYASGALPSASLGCVYSLDQTASRAISINSTVNFNCGIVVESNSSTAFHMEGAGDAYMAANTTVGVVGPSSCTPKSPATASGCGFDLTGQTYVCPPQGTACNSSNYPTANGISNPGDPLSSVAAPSATGATVYTQSYYDMNSKPAGNTLHPGVYCGGITIGNTGGATFTLASGTYIMAGGGFTVQSTGTVTGSAVTIYNTNPANAGVTCSGNPSFAPVTMTGGVNVTLSAPSTGALAGILFFQDRNLGTSSTSNQINGASNATLNGALYFKNSNLTFTGNGGSTTGYIMLVADTVTINGSANLYMNNSPLSGGGTARAIPIIGQ